MSSEHNSAAAASVHSEVEEVAPVQSVHDTSMSLAEQIAMDNAAEIEGINNLQDGDAAGISSLANGILERRATMLQQQVQDSHAISKLVGGDFNTEYRVNQIEKAATEFQRRLNRAGRKLNEAQEKSDDLAQLQKDQTKKREKAQAAVKAQANKRAELNSMAKKIEVHHHMQINRMFKTSEPADQIQAFESFVGLLRNINQAKSIDVMLYFEGRDGESPSQAHDALQFKLQNIDATTLNLNYVKKYEKAIAEAKFGNFAVCQQWAVEFCKYAKTILELEKAKKELENTNAELKNAQAYVQMWEEVVYTYDTINHELDDSFKTAADLIGQSTEAYEKMSSEIADLHEESKAKYEALHGQKGVDAFMENIPKGGDLGEADLIAVGAQKSKSKNKARASRSRVFFDE